jgi:hypothetical protein
MDVKEQLETTYKVVITLSSVGDEGVVSLEVKYEPDTEGKDIMNMGFFPASYNFVERYIVPALQQGIDDWVYTPLMNWDSPSQSRN